jgi:hypothetical protein
LTELRTFLALAAYPLIIIVVFDWFGEGSRWVRSHRGLHWPADVKLAEERKGRWLIIAKYALLIIVMRILVGHAYTRTELVKILGHPSFRFGLMGLCVGLLMFGFRRLLSLLWLDAAVAERNDYFLRGPIALWLAIFVIGGLAEELWRAVCLLSFQANDFTALSANLMTAFAFSIAHLSGTPERIAAGVPSILAESMIGLLLGGLFIWSGSIQVSYFAGLTYFILNFAVSRKIWSKAEST